MADLPRGKKYNSSLQSEDIGATQPTLSHVHPLPLIKIKVATPIQGIDSITKRYRKQTMYTDVCL